MKDKYNVKIGDKFGFLTIKGEPYRYLKPGTKSAFKYVECFCIRCNNTCLLRLDQIVNRKNPSCGCNKGYHKYRDDLLHDFFKIWSPDMAYILGFVTADGCVQKNSLRVK